MEATERLTNSPTPPLPARNPNHRYPHRRYGFVAPNSSAKLVPKPLFSKRSGLSPLRIQIEVHEIPDWSSRPSSQYSGPPSPTASFTSFASYASSTVTTVSGPGSYRDATTPQNYTFPPPDVCNWGNEWDPNHAPQPRLRRTKTPKLETLRDLRAKGSDNCLQKVYEHQLELYLNGALYPRAKWKDEMGGLEEE